VEKRRSLPSKVHLNQVDTDSALLEIELQVYQIQPRFLKHLSNGSHVLKLLLVDILETFQVRQLVLTIQLFYRDLLQKDLSLAYDLKSP